MNTNKLDASRQFGLIASQELAASFASKRGLFVTGIFILIWSFLLFYPIRLSAEAMHNPDIGSLMVSLLSLVGLEPLKNWLLAEFAIYWVVALFLFPTFSLLIAADQMISERNRGGLRFLTLRCSRGQIFFGRFIGHLSIQGILLVITLAITYLLLLINNSENWLPGLQLLPLMFLNIMVAVLPFVALMSLLSILMNSVRMASLMAIVILALGSFIINYLAGYIPFLSLLNTWIPGVQLVHMAQSTPSIALMSLWIPLMQTVGFLLIGYGIFRRQEI
jgi:ABC-type transport system involved in multi-copper enzyme maturation permease subunit